MIRGAREQANAAGRGAARATVELLSTFSSAARNATAHGVPYLAAPTSRHPNNGEVLAGSAPPYRAHMRLEQICKRMLNWRLLWYVFNSVRRLQRDGGPLRRYGA
mgnify:CR=1 FL=1